MIYDEICNASMNQRFSTLKLIFFEPNVTLLNLISHFKIHLLGIGKSNHHNFNIRMLIISCHEPYSSLSFWLFGECPFWKNNNWLTNFQLVKLIVMIIHLCPKKKSWRFHFKKKVNNVLVKSFTLLN